MTRGFPWRRLLLACLVCIGGITVLVLLVEGWR